MICSDPYVRGAEAFPCGRCPACLVNRNRIWAHRIILEAGYHAYSSFVTLTYGDDQLPRTRDGLPTLDSSHTRNWLKRFRKGRPPIRFYLAGEYSDSGRPHYHAAIFGYRSCLNGMSMYTKERDKCCSQCDAVRETWGYGNVFLGDLSVRSASYIAKYINKTMTRWDDPRLEGRHPEFSRMSNQRGLGASAAIDVALVMTQKKLEQRIVDVPDHLKVGDKGMPLGRYLRQKVRKELGRDEKAPPQSAEQKQEMLALFARAVRDGRSLGGQIREESKTALASLEYRQSLKRKDRL